MREFDRFVLKNRAVEIGLKNRGLSRDRGRGRVRRWAPCRRGAKAFVKKVMLSVYLRVVYTFL